ncbi:unnamed protein product, partial [Hapterophycus canaliculatus]
EDQDDEPRIGAFSEGTVGGVGKKHPARSSFTMGMGGSVGPRFPDWSSTGGANGTFPLRRAFTQSGESPPSSAAAVGRLKAVPLSESQATTESLRAWRKGLDARLAVSKDDGDGDGDGDGDFEEDRGRAMSLQQQTRNYAQLGRATALVMSRTKWASDVGASEDTAATAAAAAPAAAAAAAVAEAEASGESLSGDGGAVDGRGESGGSGEEEEEEEEEGGEKLLRTLSDQQWCTSRRSSSSLAAPTKSEASLPSNPVMAAFERARKEAAARQAELEEAQVARASAMVRAAAAAASGAKAAETGAQPTTSAWQSVPGGASADPSVLQLGLNDAPGSAAAASAVGLRMAADGVSNLSLRSKDSVENLQELGERSWGPLALSSSA